MITSAFTCTGPYAILIMLGIKRVENRSMMPVPARGRCAVTCSKSFNAAEYGAFVSWAAVHLPMEDFERIPAWADVKEWPGKVIGCCDYEARAAASSRPPYQSGGCGYPPSEASSEGGAMRGATALPGGAARESRAVREVWDEGYGYWWNLSNVVCFDRPIPCRGNVGMWQMPEALAAQVTAADVLARCVGEKIESAADAAHIFRAAIPLAGANEGVFVLPLDDEGRALAEPVLVSLGDPTTTAVRPGDVFGVAFRHEAASVIIAHNHPSGDPTPSAQDRHLTAALRAFGEQLGVKVLDHLVIGDEDVSLRAAASSRPPYQWGTNRAAARPESAPYQTVQPGCDRIIRSVDA